MRIHAAACSPTNSLPHSLRPLPRALSPRWCNAGRALLTRSCCAAAPPRCLQARRPRGSRRRPSGWSGRGSGRRAAGRCDGRRGARMRWLQPRSGAPGQQQHPPDQRDGVQGGVDRAAASLKPGGQCCSVSALSLAGRFDRGGGRGFQQISGGWEEISLSLGFPVDRQNLPYPALGLPLSWISAHPQLVYLDGERASPKTTSTV